MSTKEITGQVHRNIYSDTQTDAQPLCLACSQGLANPYGHCHIKHAGPIGVGNAAQTDLGPGYSYGLTEELPDSSS